MNRVQIVDVQSGKTYRAVKRRKAAGYMRVTLS